MYDVLIVGAGSAGSHVAARLAALGHKVIVFEEHQKPGKAACCTGIVGKECLDSFPVDRGVILREAKSATFFSPSGRSLRVAQDTVQAYILDRAHFDLCLSAKAQEAGADHVWNSRVKDIQLGAESVRVEIEKSSNVFEGKAIVIAAGFSSRLTEKVGLGRIRSFAVGAQVEVTAEAVDEVQVHFGRRITPGFFGWVVPSSEGRARVGLLAHDRPVQRLKAFLSELPQRGTAISGDGEMNCGGVPLGPLDRTFRDRVIVVGDAAGQVKPTTAGGIYFGLLCADIAADTLHQAIAAGDFRSATLADYEERWKERIGKELRAGRRARWLFEHLSDRRIDRIFRVVQSREIHTRLLNSPEFSFDWHRSMIVKSIQFAGLRGVWDIMRP